MVAALRVLDALAATSPSVGAPMDICRIGPDGARHFNPDEVEVIRNRVNRWVELEPSAGSAFRLTLRSGRDPANRT
jgi:proteasome beta subunit